MKRILLASSCAVAAQPLLFVIWVLVLSTLDGTGLSFNGDELLVLFLIVLVASAHLVLLGLPAFWALNKWGKATICNVALVGFAIGGVAIAVVTWPVSPGDHSHSAFWHGRYIELVVNGMPTTAGWLNYFEGITQLGMHGVVGAWAFLAVWRLYRCSSDSGSP